MTEFCTRVHFCMLVTILMFIFSKFCRSYNFRQTWPHNLILLSKSTEITLLMCDFSKYLPFINFWGKKCHFIPKSVVLHIYWNLAWYDEVRSNSFNERYNEKYDERFHEGSWNFKISRKQDGQFRENKMERSFPIIFWTRKYWKIKAFDYNQQQHQILGPNLPKIVWMTRLLKKQTLKW